MNHAEHETDETDDRGETPDSRAGVSPYATGGGGVTLERRVGAWYLALLLTGETAPELGDDRHVTSVAFQQAPRVAIDDLVVSAARPDELTPSLRLAIGVRRRPNLVRSDENAQQLMVEYVRALLQTRDDGREDRLGLAVAGSQPHATQLAELTVLARAQQNASEFFELLRTPQRFQKAVVDRLGHVEDLVKHALLELGTSEPEAELVRLRTWQLLRCLHVVSLRVEEPDTAAWAATQNRLVDVARGRDLAGAGRLRERLEVLAGRYGPQAATVDASLLRREVHALLEAGRPRHRQGWQLLEQMERLARAAVRDRIGHEANEGSLALDRSSDAEAIIAALDASAALLVSGDSGVGKSALVLGAAAWAAEDADDDSQVVYLNLRQLPENWPDLVTGLGAPLADVLAEMSAPRRYLVVDAADAAAESRRDLFAYLVDAAASSDVRVVAVASNEVRQVISDLLDEQLGGDRVASYEVSDLSDEQLAEVAAAFPALQRLAETPRSRELLRRLVVVDLLVRSQVTGVPLSDAEAMRDIWAGLIRRREQRDRGLPDAREQVMMGLAVHALGGQPAAELDAVALDGLRQDGLLRSAQDNPWQVLPEFAHDEIRRYAVARVLLKSRDLGAALDQVQAPRWALSAATLAAQAVLARPDTPDTPLRGRLAALQASFDAVVAAGYGARWADVPHEALLTLGDPAPVLADAWPQLRADDGTGLRRLLRVLDQRHRTPGQVIDPVVADPVIALLLDDAVPWRVSDEAAALLRNWLLSLVVSEAPADHPLRLRLQERIVAACEQAQERLDAARREVEAARAARSAEQQQERELEESQQSLAQVLGMGPRRRRRRRDELPRELTDEIVVELLALLGRDLGEAGEQLLRRLATESPVDLAPALEEPGTGRALGVYGHGLLGDLVEAYYLDEDEDSSGWHEDGIRRHRFGGIGMPLTAWYRGPFMALFQADPRRGVAVLNRLLNHAARARARTLAGLSDPWGSASQAETDSYSSQLRITGHTRTYVGDDHVWRWYRGTGVGPYPCMSALQALERFCDQLLAANVVSAQHLVGLLLDGCENLAMPGLVTGLLVRHLERAGTLLDPFFAEPVAWRFEFERVTSESTGLAASSEGLAHPERRTWSLHEAAMWLTIQADSDRADELRAVGEKLVARAVELTRESAQDVEEGLAEERGDDVTVVRGWASALDRRNYTAQAEADRVVFQSTPPEDVQAALEPDNEDLRRGEEALRIQMRYFRAADPRRADAPPPTQDELAKDLVVAQELVADPPTRSAAGIPEMAAAITAYALRALVAGEADLDEQARTFVVEVILEIAEHVASPDPFEFEGSFFEMGADRAAARSLPWLLLPSAAPLRGLARPEPDDVDERVLAAGRHLAQATAMETRLLLARGLDVVWSTPCQVGGECHHQRGVQLAIESMRDCVLGEWREARRQIEILTDPVVETLAAVPDEDIFVTKLDAAIRALSVAAVSDVCVAAEAREFLTVLLLAQRRGFLVREENFDERGSHALVAARALLALAGAGDAQPLRQHIAAYADRSVYLSSLLRGFAAAAEETTEAAHTARQLWPSIIEQVLELSSSGHQPFSGPHYGDLALAALAPTPSADIEFMYREVGNEPIAWRDPLGWQDALEAWVPIAAGKPMCIDSFIGLVRAVPVEQQISFGLPRVARLVYGDVEAASARSYMLAEWLKELRAAALDAESLAAWQRLVDTLVVAGNRTLAPYSQ